MLTALQTADDGTIHYARGSFDPCREETKTSLDNPRPLTEEIPMHQTYQTINHFFSVAGRQDHG